MPEYRRRSALFVPSSTTVNLSPVTGADGIFRFQGGLFTQYWGTAEQSPESQKFPSVPVICDSFFFLHIIFKDKNRTNGFDVCVNECTIYFSSIWIYTFIHKWFNDIIWLHTFIYKFSATSLNIMMSFKTWESSYTGGGWCKMKFSSTGTQICKKTLFMPIKGRYEIFLVRLLKVTEGV